MSRSATLAMRVPAGRLEPGTHEGKSMHIKEPARRHMQPYVFSQRFGEKLFLCATLAAGRNGLWRRKGRNGAVQGTAVGTKFENQPQRTALQRQDDDGCYTRASTVAHVFRLSFRPGPGINGSTVHDTLGRTDVRIGRLKSKRWVQSLFPGGLGS